MLHVHRSERADGLVGALADLLAVPQSDPLAPEVVAVPTRGMERWLTQRMSHRLGASAGRSDGVCANVGFPSPRALVADAVAVSSGIDPAQDPWVPERAVWTLLDVVDGCLQEPWLRPLAAHVGGATPGARRFSSVRHLADLFDSYALHRPEMVQDWAAGGAAGTPARAAWQPELWRRLCDRIAVPDPSTRLQGACARLRDEPALVELPERISLFGLTRLPAGHLQVLRALAGSREVHLFLLHPSPALWQRVAVQTTAHPRPVLRRSDDPTAGLAQNRLLGSWGQDARELQLVVGAADADHHHAVEHGARTLLHRLQADVRADRSPPGVPHEGSADARPELAPDDSSVQIHACHGQARQVEIVRDAILHELAADPSLEPRDVIVMCPDIETFAPLINATFGVHETAGADEAAEELPAGARPPDLRVRLADRSLRQTNPILGVVGALIDLAGQRLTASQVLDLADREPVRRRFRFDDDDLSRVEGWTATSGIRWGLDAAHRVPFELAAQPAGTWRAGLDRLLLGVAMTEEEQRLFGGVLPLDDVGSGSIDLVGRFSELVDRLGAALDALSAPQPVAAWAEAIGAAADALTATTLREGWQRAELERILDDLVTQAGDHATVLTLPEIRALLAERLKGRPTRANFRTGHLTICTLVPMRSVPHRIVCLLGLDDAVFPRRAPRDGDDLMLEEPRVGDRDARIEDRQMLLDALLAATDKLIVTYTGNDERTNIARPPAVPVGELLDSIDRTVRGPGGVPARRAVSVRHPLQPFDPRNFTRGALVRGRAWSFDEVALAGAQAMIRERRPPAPFLAGPLEDLPDGDVVEVEQLVRFVEHPVRAFLRRRLGIGVRDSSDEVADALPVDLDGLGRWGVGQRLLDARLAGVEPRVAALAEIARGTLPPGALGQPVIEQVLPVVEEIVHEARAAAAAVAGTGHSASSADVRLVLEDGRRLGGTVPGLVGDVVRTVTYSRVGPKHRLAGWVRLLALTAADPERPYATATIGRAGGRGGVTVARIRPLGPDADTRRAQALGHLATLVELYDRGLREPLPIFCAASAAYAQAVATGADPIAAGCRAWESDFSFPKEDVEPEHQLVLGGVRTFAEVLATPSGPGEDGSAEGSRFAHYAVALWEGLLAYEELRAR